MLKLGRILSVSATSVSVALIMLIPPGAYAGSRGLATAPGVSQVLGSMNSTSDMALWNYHYEGTMMRAKLDLAVSNLLETDPDARKALAEAILELNSMIDQQELPLDASAARSSADIDPKNKNRKLLQEMAAAHGFSKEAVKNAKLWTTIGTVNAYTFSAVHDRLDVVAYQELLDLMGPNEIKAVLAHELGHVHMKHVLTGMVVQAVFDAAGKNLIPNEVNSVAFQSNLRSNSATLLKKAIDFDGPVADAIVKILQDKAAIIGEHLIRDIGPVGIARLANNMHTALGGSTNLFEIQGTSVMAVDKGSIGDQKSFKASNTRLTRDQERTADRWAALLAGPEALASSMAKLAGGRFAKSENILKQAKELLQRTANGVVDLSQIDKGDHPQTVIRVAAAIQFSETQNFRIMKDPFLRGVDTYLKMRVDIDDEQKRIEDNKVEQIVADRLMFNINSMKTFSSKLEDAIVFEVVNEVAAQKSLDKTGGLIRMLDNTSPYGPRADTSRLGKYDLFSKLQTGLAGLQGNATATALMAEIAIRAPVTASTSSMSRLLGTLPPKAPVSCRAVIK